MWTLEITFSVSNKFWLSICVSRGKQYWKPWKFQLVAEYYLRNELWELGWGEKSQNLIFTHTHTLKNILALTGNEPRKQCFLNFLQLQKTVELWEKMSQRISVVPEEVSIKVWNEIYSSVVITIGKSINQEMSSSRIWEDWREKKGDKW